MKVHRALGLACRARSKRDHRRVVGRGPDVVEARRLASGKRLEPVDAIGCAPRDRPQRRTRGTGVIELGRQAGVAERVRDLRLDDDVGQLLRAQQRHRWDRDCARLEDGEPAGGDQRCVGRAQQHSIARDDAEIFDERVRDAVRLLQQLGVRPAQAGRRDDRGAFGKAAF